MLLLWPLNEYFNSSCLQCSQLCSSNWQFIMAWVKTSGIAGMHHVNWLPGTVGSMHRFITAQAGGFNQQKTSSRSQILKRRASKPYIKVQDENAFLYTYTRRHLTVLIYHFICNHILRVLHLTARGIKSFLTSRGLWYRLVPHKKCHIKCCDGCLRYTWLPAGSNTLGRILLKTKLEKQPQVCAG